MLSVYDEDKTIDIVLSGRSISRFGEGELRFIYGRNLKSQKYNNSLANELREVLSTKSSLLVGIPRLWRDMPNYPFWRQFESIKYTSICNQKEYGSSFISRPDVAANIDRPDYWNKIRSIWRDKDVILVSHGHVLKMLDASNVQLIKCPPTNAYDEIDRIEEEIGNPSCPVILCLGATATVLSARLNKKGIYSLDLGHMGLFLPHAGAYSVDRRTLISDEYIKQNKELHARPAGFGGSGHKSAADVLAFAYQIGADQMLDFGCGRQTLAQKMRELGWKKTTFQYDPCIPGLDIPPKPADLVTCTDVLEHVEPDKLVNVLKYIYSLTKKAAFFLVATRSANKILPDGRNAHLIQEDADWWREKIKNTTGFKIIKESIKIGHEAKFWCLKEN